MLAAWAVAASLTQSPCLPMGSCSHSTLEATGCIVAVACCCQSRCVSRACLHYTIIMSLCLLIVLWCAIVDSEGCSSSCSQRMLFVVVNSQVHQGQFTGEAPAPPLQPQYVPCTQYVLAAACPTRSLHNAGSRCGTTPVSCCAQQERACQPLLAVTPAPGAWWWLAGVNAAAALLVHQQCSGDFHDVLESVVASTTLAHSLGFCDCRFSACCRVMGVSTCAWHVAQHGRPARGLLPAAAANGN